MNSNNLNQEFRKRTSHLANEIIKFYDGIQRKKDSIYIIGKQLIRSTTSVAANYRAVCLARSRKEQFAKLCIVTEEADEVLYWLETLEETSKEVVIPDFIKKESLEIAKVMTVYRSKLKKHL